MFSGVEDVAEDEDAVGLAPEGDVPRRVPGDVDDLEGGDLVSLAKGAVDPVGGPGHVSSRRSCAMKWSGWRSPMSLGFSAARMSFSPTQKGTPKLLADGVRSALMVGVGVGQGVRGERASLELLDDLPRCEAGRASMRTSSRRKTLIAFGGKRDSCQTPSASCFMRGNAMSSRIPEG